MIKTIIQLADKVSLKHFQDKGKPVFVVVNGEKHNISTVDEYDDEVLIPTVPVENGGEVKIIEG